MTGSPEPDRPGAALDLVHSAIRTRWRGGADARPLVVGICGSQGSGKSTLSERLERQLALGGTKVALLSLDDLYLSHSARAALAARVHPLLATRGVPGTHDIALGDAVIADLLAGKATRLPRFDKATDTRVPASLWPVTGTKVDVLLFEGWCVGAVPQPEASLTVPVNALERDEDPGGIWRRFVNAALAGPYRRLFAHIDLLVLLAAPGFEVVEGWRRQQERMLRERLEFEGQRLGRSLDDADIARFVSHYQRLTEHILSEMPGRADLVIRLDAERRVLGSETRAC